MAGALTWTLGLVDKMSGPGAAMGGVLTSIASKFRTATAATDAFQKKQESAFRVPARAITAPVNAPLRTTATTLGDVNGGDLAANMRKHDAQAFAEVEKKAAAATRAIEAYNKAISKSSAGTLGTARSTMGKTGANTSGVTDGMKAPDVGGFAALIQKLSALHPALGSAAQGMGDFAVKADGALASVGGLEGVLGGIGGALASVAGMALKTAAAVAAIAVGLAAAGAKYVTSAQMFKSEMMTALTANAGGAAGAKASWAEISALALSTGSDLQQTATAFNGLLAGGFSTGEASEPKMLADMTKLDPTANLDGISLAIKQIKMTGKLQGDELNQLGNAVSIDAVYKQLAKKLGKTKEEVIKLKEAGKITSDQAIDAIKKATMAKTGKALGGLAEEAAGKTLVGNLMRAKVAADVFASNLNIDFTPVQRFLGKLTTAFQGDSAKKFGTAVESAMNGVIGLIDHITAEDIASVFDAGTWALEALSTVVSKVGGAISYMNSLLGSSSLITTTLSNAVAVVSNAFSTLGAVASFSFELISNPLAAFTNLLAFAIDQVLALVSALTGIKMPSVGDMIDSAFGVGSPDAAKAAQNANKPGAPDPLADAIRKATGPQPGQPATPGAAAPGAPPGDAKPGVPPPRGPTSVTISANGLTFEGFEAKVAEIVRAEMEKG